jgi:hypothetical protein
MMELIKDNKAAGITAQSTECAQPDLSDIGPEPDEKDQQAYEGLISIELSPEQEERIRTPPQVYPKQEALLAVHWHPEFIPLELIRERIEAMYPGKEEELIIPTQHNVLVAWDGYTGVEVDCYSSGFKRKVQLLMHFRSDRLEHAEVLKSMLRHTFKYRSGQLFDFIDSVVNPDHEDRLQQAAAETGATEELIQFTRLYTARLKKLFEINEAITPTMAIKNKLLTEYFDTLRGEYPDRLVNRAQLLLKAVKQIVKANFSLQYFYRASEVIEEARSVGGCVVIPHPEQFWPILLADYDVDGYEVWNPQSREYTEFLINVVNRHNRSLAHSDRRILIFMGDDTHLGEKAKPPHLQKKEKAAREVGLQPAWDDLDIKKSLIVANVDRSKVIQEYKARLA